MRKAYLSILWIITVICIIGGTIYHVGGLVQFAGNNIFSYVTNGGLKKEQAGPLVSDQYDLTVENNRAAINVDGSYMDFTLQKGDSWGASYSGVEWLKPELDVTEEDGVTKLVFTQPDAAGRNLNKYYNLNSSLTIMVPENVSFTDLNITLNLGDLDMTDVKADQVELNLDLGDLDVENCNVGTFTSNMDMGDTTIQKTELKNADINANMGDIEVTDSEFKDMKLTADMGEIAVKSAISLEDYRIDADVSMGDVKVNGKKYSDDYSQKGNAGELTVDSSMGDAEIAW